MKLKTISLITFGLFIISLFVYSNENRRGTDLISGSDFIKGLDVAKIYKINLNFSGNNKITLLRDGNQFVVKNHKGYPADNAKINDLIYKIASLQVREKVADDVSEDDLARYKLGRGDHKYLIEIFDNDDRKTVSFRVGKSHKVKGNYLYKEGKDEVYLSQETIWLNSSYKDFINTVLLKINSDDVEKIVTGVADNLEVERTHEKFKDYFKEITEFKFEDFYTITEPKVQRLNFDKQVQFLFKNKLVYKLSLAKDSQEHFVKLSALIDEAPEKIMISQNDSQDKLENVEKILEAQTKAQKTNSEKGAWVYKIDEKIYKNLLRDKKYFL